MTAILTAAGVPYARPDKPRAGASADELITYMRALHAYNDAVADDANRAFAESFAAAMRGGAL